MLGGWALRSVRGSAADLHALAPAADSSRSMWWLEVDRPALVLGSAQPESSVDLARCAAEGIEVVRRRSGGGSVLMWPGEIVWVDVIVPTDDPRWDADVGRAMWWVGEWWVEVLDVLGAAPGADVHRGPLVATDWSRLVCFDGVGGGEVLVDGRKAVGISQRRTRHWIRLQTALHRVWRADLVRDLVVPPWPDPEGPSAPWVLPDTVSDDDVRAALVAGLERR